MTAWKRTAGDVADTIVAYLDGITGTPTASEAHVGLTTGTDTAPLTSTCVAGVDQQGAACLIHTITLGTWLAGLTLTVSETPYELEHQITFADSRIITWKGDIIIVQRPRG